MGKHRKLMTYAEYLASDVWKCEKSPTGAHHWIGIGKETSGLFYCKWCLDVKKGPGSWQEYSRMAYGGRVPLSRPSKGELLAFTDFNV